MLPPWGLRGLERGRSHPVKGSSRSGSSEEGASGRGEPAIKNGFAIAGEGEGLNGVICAGFMRDILWYIHEYTYIYICISMNIVN